MLSRTTLLVLLGMKLACGTEGEDKTQSSSAIARVHGQYLYKHDLENIGADVTNPQDSVELIEGYIQSWIAKQLMIAKAEEQGGYNKADIERKILDYRYALIVHSFIEKLVNAKLNKEVSQEEIQRYYQEHQENFRLKHNIVRGRFIVIPKDAPNKARLKTLLASKQEADIAALKSYCCQFAKDYSLDESVWLSWDDVIKSTPFNRVPDKTRLLKKTKCTEIQDDECSYYLKINAYKLINDTSPIDFVKDQMADIIIYKRKIALANQIKEGILQQAKANNDYTIYEH